MIGILVTSAYSQLFLPDKILYDSKYLLPYIVIFTCLTEFTALWLTKNCG